MNHVKAPFRATYFPPSDMRVERRADGTLVVEPLDRTRPVRAQPAGATVGVGRA